MPTWTEPYQGSVSLSSVYDKTWEGKWLGAWATLVAPGLRLLLLFQSPVLLCLGPQLGRYHWFLQTELGVCEQNWKGRHVHVSGHSASALAWTKKTKQQQMPPQHRAPQPNLKGPPYSQGCLPKSPHSMQPQSDTSGLSPGDPQP